MDLQSLKELFHTRLDRIVRLARRLPENRPHPIIERFRLDFVSGGELENLVFDQYNEPFPDQTYKKISDRPRMHISSDAQKCFFRVSQQLLGMFQNLESILGKDALEAAIDSYLVHEIIHRHQGMGEGNHRNLSVLGPSVLAVLDYEADACSALILFAFMMVEEYETNGHFGWLSQDNAREKWVCFAKCIRSNIFQIYVFSLFDYQKGTVIDARKSALRNTGIARLKRIYAWHMQYHRALRFSNPHPISSMQILSKPDMDFRNQEYAYAKKKLNAYWPAYEHKKTTSKARRTRAPNKKIIQRQIERMWVEPSHLKSLVLSIPGRHLIRETIQYTPNHVSFYSALFEGIFTCKTERSEIFFAALFNEHRFFTNPGCAPSEEHGDDSITHFYSREFS